MLGLFWARFRMPLLLANGKMKSLRINRLNNLIAAMGVLNSSEVLVGVPKDHNVRKEEEADEEAPPNNAMIAFLMDKGSPANNIPARPFMEPGIAKVKGKLSETLAKAAKATLSNGSSAVESYLNRAGLIAQSSIRGTINDGKDFTPLSEGTLRARRARGRTGTKPLIDTGQLRNSITYVIKRG